MEVQKKGGTLNAHGFCQVTVLSIFHSFLASKLFVLHECARVCVHIDPPSCMYTALKLASFDLETSAQRSSFPDTAISDGLWLVVQFWTLCQILNSITVRNVHIT